MAASATPVNDTFNGSLNSAWQWVRQDTANESLTSNAGWLTINGMYGSIYGSKSGSQLSKNILIQPVSATDNFTVTVEAQFKTPPTQAYDSAHLMFYQNDENYFTVDREYGDTPTGSTTPTMFYDATVNTAGKITVNTASTAGVAAQGLIDPKPTAEPFWLQIQKQGNTFTALYSEDGTNFTKIYSGTYTINATLPTYIGIGAWDGLGMPSFTPEPVEFKDFTVTVGASSSSSSSPTATGTTSSSSSSTKTSAASSSAASSSSSTSLPKTGEGWTVSLAGAVAVIGGLLLFADVRRRRFGDRSL